MMSMDCFCVTAQSQLKFKLLDNLLLMDTELTWLTNIQMFNKGIAL